MPKDQILKPKLLIDESKFFGAKIYRSVAKKIVQKNWYLIAIYLAITALGIVVSYFTSGWMSVASSLIVTIATFCIGYRMFREVITITLEPP